MGIVGAFSVVGQVVALAVGAFSLLDSIFSKNTKQAETFNKALTSSEESVANVTRTLQAATTAEGFGSKTIANTVALSNAFNELTTSAKEALKTEIKDGWTGTENSDGVTISVNDSAEEAIVVDTIEPRGRNEQFVTYDETAEIKLMAAHSAMNILFQRPGSSGFSNNADEIATATDSLYLGVINPMREIILDALNLIFKKIEPNCDIDFVNFGQEKAIVSDVTDENAVVDDVTGNAQAQLKGSVGGVQSLLEVQSSYAAGTTTYESAIAILDLIFGFNREQAIRLLGKPEKIEPINPITND